MVNPLLQQSYKLSQELCKRQTKGMAYFCLMLKKTAYIILAFYLLTTIVGFSVSRHYCGDRLVSTQIDVVDDCDCDMSCGMCEVEVEYVHLASDFVVEHSLVLNQNFDFSSFPAIAISLSPIHSQETNLAAIGSSPHTLVVSRRLALIQSFRC